MGPTLLTLHVGRIERRLADGERVSRIIVEDFHLAAHQNWVLLGPSGSGKTTALEMLALAQLPDESRDFQLVRPWDAVALGRDAGNEETTARLRGTHFGYVLQSVLLLPFLTIVENILVTQQIAGRVDLDYARALMDRLQLTGLADSFPARLSVGQRQRACVARALAHQPSFVMADEPTSALDAVTADLCMSTMIEACQVTGAALLLVTHDEALAARFNFDRCVLATVTDGRLMETRISQLPATGSAAS